MLDYSFRPNYWKAAVLGVLWLAAAAAASAAGYGALRGYQAFSFLNAPVGAVGDKPITRANYLDLLLAREAQAAQKAPPVAPEVK